MTGINKTVRTTKKDHIYILMRREGKVWRRVDMVLFTKRSQAREAVNELNNLQPLRRGKRERRYRVGIMKIVRQKP